MSNICMECGLCCDGTVFYRAPIAREDDLVPLARKGLTVVTSDDGQRSFFLQPCQALESRCCTIYDQKPAACGKYKCKLLDKVESGETDFESAREVVSTIIEQRDRVLPVLQALAGTAETSSLLSLLAQVEAKLEAEPDVIPEDERGSLFLQVAALRLLIATHIDAKTAHTT
jgi:Fe-S-cluster containining protein